MAVVVGYYFFILGSLSKAVVDSDSISPGCKPGETAESTEAVVDSDRVVV
jgi:hypothetical protein